MAAVGGQHGELQGAVGHGGQQAMAVACRGKLTCASASRVER